MAWYKTGTVTVTNNSSTVTGSGTNFVSGAQVGFGFQGPNGLVYEITAINSSTSLTITPVYGGSTASGQSYAIVPTQGLTAALASDVTDLITDYQTVADNAGAGKFGDGSAASPGIRFVNDQDTGFFKDTANEIAVSVGGTKVGEFTSTGIDGTVIGGTTPAAGSFTTLSASTSITGARDGAGILYLNRLTSDGEIARFQKDGTTVGSIGSRSGGGTIYIDGASNFSGLQFNGDAVVPRYNGATLDNAIDLGASSIRYDDLYATNGTIQTSDQNEKQQIAPLTDAEMAAAKAISAGFKTFKWNDSFAEKGDAARIHSGVIAQEVEQAMTGAGLDAGDYAFFVSTTWCETQTDVPAVEAVEAVDAVYDKEGNVLTEAVESVEGKEAYTRTDTYDTAEEAPEGATERNRKGIRYPQLLAFVGAATEQRLASVEARLEALE